MMAGMAWRAASMLLVAAIFVGHVQATWKWENNSTHRPASASSVVTSSSSISTSSSSSVSIGPQHDLLVVPTTLVHSETSGQDGLPHTEQEGRRPTQKSSRALEDDPSDAGTRDLEAAPSDTEPRFIGRLKKKLCSVGLGFNKEVVFKDCKGVQKKVRSRRDTEEDKGTRGEPSPRFLGGLLGGVASGSGLDGIKKPGFAPSFGINFGSLPTGSGYGPYGGNNNPLGLDLGPVSINPFVGFKLASLDGRPILNPSLDLLVTPNAKGVHALKGLKDKFKHDFDSYKGYGGGYGGGYYPGGYYPGGHYSGGGYPYGGYYPSSPYYQYGGYPQSYYPHSQTYAPKPIYTPPKPVYTPPKPVYTPPKPVYRPPSYTPSYYRPKPIANYGNQYTRPKPSYSHHHKPVEVLHHHEHTHYHDYDRYDDSYGDSFSPSFSPYGRSESLKSDRSSISPSTLPLSASSRLPSSSSSRLPPIAASASRLPSSRLLPHSSTSSSSFSPSTPSSFKGSASSPLHSTFSARSDTGKSPSGFKFPDT